MRTRLAVCLACVVLTGVAGTPAASRSAALTPDDLRWLARVTFGIDNAAVARYRQLGREKFLDEQLHPPAEDPPNLAAAIAAIPVTQRPAADRMQAVFTEQRRINALTSDDEKQQARAALNQAANQAVYETAKRHLMRALLSPSQLREQMTWFWMNPASSRASKHPLDTGVERRRSARTPSAGSAISSWRPPPRQPCSSISTMRRVRPERSTRTTPAS
jgi:uncharacterized protein (DUF1800 family)